MVKAFVFGKFLPFHKGHEAMINFALTQCDHLTVLICCSDTESTPGTVREHWLKSTFSRTNNISIETFYYQEKELPNTSQASKEISKVWAEVFTEKFPDHNIVITSEEYGDYVASYMNIRHIPFDIPKKIFPVSATAVRQNLFANWHFLPESVKPYFTLKVVILGTESTGKSTLTAQLAQHFNCSSVNEAARDIIGHSDSFTINDLYLVASEHAKRIQKAAQGHSPLVIIDTDIHITQSYCRHTFHQSLELSADIYNANRANLYLYLNNDVEYVQDGTRLSEAERDSLDYSHRKTLTEHNVSLIEIRGDWNDRLEQAIKAIEELIPGPC